MIRLCDAKSNRSIGTDLPGVQRFESWCASARPESRFGVGTIRDSRKHHLARLHRDRNGRSTLRAVPRAKERLAYAKHVGQTQ